MGEHVKIVALYFFFFFWFVLFLALLASTPPPLHFNGRTRPPFCFQPGVARRAQNTVKVYKAADSLPDPSTLASGSFVIALGNATSTAKYVNASVLAAAGSEGFVLATELTSGGVSVLAADGNALVPDVMAIGGNNGIGSLLCFGTCGDMGKGGGWGFRRSHFVAVSAFVMRLAVISPVARVLACAVVQAPTTVPTRPCRRSALCTGTPSSQPPRRSSSRSTRTPRTALWWMSNGLTGRFGSGTARARRLDAVIPPIWFLFCPRTLPSPPAFLGVILRPTQAYPHRAPA